MVGADQAVSVKQVSFSQKSVWNQDAQVALPPWPPRLARDLHQQLAGRPRRVLVSAVEHITVRDMSLPLSAATEAKCSPAVTSK